MKDFLVHILCLIEQSFARGKQGSKGRAEELKFEIQTLVFEFSKKKEESIGVVAEASYI